MVNILEHLIQSKVKRKLLKLFLFNKTKKYHTRELSRVIDEPISAVQRELKKLLELQILIKEPKGNTINYSLDINNPFIQDLKSLFLKTTTEPKAFFGLLIKSSSLGFIALYGDIIKQPMNFSIPIKLLVVGELDKELLGEYLSAIMDVFNRPYEVLHFTTEEFLTKKEGDADLLKILSAKNLLILKDTLG